ncbi:MAG TPA: amidohydrolase family protein [Gemmatimonadota bacterium]|nr:amidohydrolase family protein [Gemmatimonadota bacterium]
MRVPRPLAPLALLWLLVPPAAAQDPGGADTLPTAVARYVTVDAPVVALVGVRVVDGTGAPAEADRTIVLRDGRIEAVGAAGEVAVPEDAEVLDLAGHTVIPGIVGLHDHTFYTTSGRRAQLTWSAPRLYLASGVTTIRTTGSYHPYSEVNLAAAIEDGLEPGPRIHVTGPYLTGVGGAGYMTQVGTPEDARRVVAYWAEEGATWFKAYTAISRAELAAVIDEAHARGLKVTGHLCSVSFREAVALGIDNLEHGFFTNTDYDSAKRPDECPSEFRRGLLDVEIDSDEVRATFRDMIDHGVALTSTLAIYELLVPGRPPLEQRTLDALAPESREDYLRSRDEIARDADTSIWPELFRKAQAFERAFHEAGGLLAAGVDPTGIGGALPGFGDQRNYELLIEAGFTPEETIRVMTLNGATVLGEDALYGSIEPGKLAELVVIEGDPVARPEEIRNVTLVFRNGLGFDSEKILEDVRGAVGIR